MGGTHSVGVIQYLMWRVASREGSWGAGLQHSAEVRRDRMLPDAAVSCSTCSMCSVFLDNLDIEELICLATAVERLCLPLDWQLALRSAFVKAGMRWSPDKSEMRLQTAKLLGLLFDGYEGLAGPDGARCSRLVNFTAIVLRAGEPAENDACSREAGALGVKRNEHSYVAHVALPPLCVHNVADVEGRCVTCRSPLVGCEPLQARCHYCLRQVCEGWGVRTHDVATGHVVFVCQGCAPPAPPPEPPPLVPPPPMYPPDVNLFCHVCLDPFVPVVHCRECQQLTCRACSVQGPWEDPSFEVVCAACLQELMFGDQLDAWFE
jgi:hypothetical protein